MTEESTAAVWHQLGADLRRFIRRRVRDEHTAEDLLQETFVRIHRGLAGQGGAGRLQAWVYRIARNVVNDYYRGAAGAAAALGSADPAGPAADPRDAFRCRSGAWLEELIGELPERYRAAVQLSEVEGLTQQQVADRLGLSLSGAKSRIQRGRALLRQGLDRCCSFEFDRRGNLVDVDPKPHRTFCRDCGDEVDPGCG
jgi:RNA polymerase sigma-70 factor (ECF subfamily)